VASITSDEVETRTDVSVATLPVRHDPASAAVVRHELAMDLRRLRVDPARADDVILVASELVANAIRHAAPVSARKIEVTWDFEGKAIVIRVGDGSPVEPHRRHTSAVEPSGRGLTIVEALSDAWGVEHTPRGKRVWARLTVRS
jgi:two-component sensor histidine kinase